MRKLSLLGFVALGILGCGDVENTAINPPELPAPEIGYRASLYDTSWPADMANLNRTNAVNSAGFPVGTTSDDVTVTTVEVPFPGFAYSRGENEIFVIGGAPFLLGNFDDLVDGTQTLDQLMEGMKQGQQKAFELMMGGTPPAPHITKYNPSTGELKTIDLTLGKTVPYIGGALVHANGFVYVISQSHLYKIDGDSMEIVDSTPLPTAPEPETAMTIYNGLATSTTGELISKFFVLEGAASKFMLIDPDTLELTFELDYPGASPRLTVDRNADGNEYLYHLNSRNTFRFLIEKGSLTLDEDWQSRYDPYNTGLDENDEPTSPVIAGDRVFYTTNTSFTVKNPMKVFWQSQNQTYDESSPPLSGYDLFEGAENPGWNFFHLSIDDATGTIIGTDQGNGLITAVRGNETGKMERLWQKNLRVSARVAIVSDRKMVYATDHVDGHNDLVVLDLMTGEELIRKTTPATRATISTIIVTRNNEVYFGSNEPGMPTGLFHRFHVAGSE